MCLKMGTGRVVISYLFTCCPDTQLQEYEARPGHYWYRRQCYPSLLRIEDAPPPPAAALGDGAAAGTALGPVRTAAAGGGGDASEPGLCRAGSGAGAQAGPPTMVDVFAGLGTVAHASQDSGFQVLGTGLADWSMVPGGRVEGHRVEGKQPAGTTPGQENVEGPWLFGQQCYTLGPQAALQLQP